MPISTCSEETAMRNYAAAIDCLDIGPLSLQLEEMERKERERRMRVEAADEAFCHALIEQDVELEKKRLNLDREKPMYDAWNERFTPETYSHGPYTARQLVHRQEMEENNLQRMVQGVTPGNLMAEPWYLDPKYCSKEEVGGVSWEDRLEIHNVAVSELVRIGNYWDPEAKIGPPIPEYSVQQSGEPFCPCNSDQRQCLRCWNDELNNDEQFGENW